MVIPELIRILTEEKNFNIDTAAVSYTHLWICRYGGRGHHSDRGEGAVRELSLIHIYSYGITNYCDAFSSECSYSLGEDEFGREIRSLPKNSRYIKSEDILYEVKKVQQKQVLSDGMLYDYIKRGMKKEDAEKYLQSKEGSKQMEYIMYAQDTIPADKRRTEGGD